MIIMHIKESGTWVQDSGFHGHGNNSCTLFEGSSTREEERIDSLRYSDGDEMPSLSDSWTFSCRTSDCTLTTSSAKLTANFKIQDLAIVVSYHSVNKPSEGERYACVDTH